MAAKACGNDGVQVTVVDVLAVDVHLLDLLGHGRDLVPRRRLSTAAALDEQAVLMECRALAPVRPVRVEEAHARDERARAAEDKEDFVEESVCGLHPEARPEHHRAEPQTDDADHQIRPGGLPVSDKLRLLCAERIHTLLN
jgi:hypothetical protein